MAKYLIKRESGSENYIVLEKETKTIIVHLLYFSEDSSYVIPEDESSLDQDFWYRYQHKEDALAYWLINTKNTFKDLEYDSNCCFHQELLDIAYNYWEHEFYMNGLIKEEIESKMIPVNEVLKFTTLTEEQIEKFRADIRYNFADLVREKYCRD